MWTDNETALDLIGFRVHADLIRSVVMNQKLLPVTIGVFADWGGGKTSLMKMLEHDLDPENHTAGSAERTQREKIACLYFNGWMFEGYDDAKSAILSSVLLALGEHKRFGPKVRDKVVGLLKSVNWMRIAHLGLKHVAMPAIVAYATGGASLVPAIAASAGAFFGAKSAQPPAPATTPPTTKEKPEAEKINWEELINKDPGSAGPLDARTFREQFGVMLKECNVESLVVLIDDLDRCSPERIVENLEAIKLFLNVENTAFVIGADPRIVRHAVAWKYKGYGEAAGEGETEKEAGDRLVTDYLEKVIQYPYRLPRLSPAEIETYMVLLFCQHHLAEGAFKDVVAGCEEQRQKNRYAVFGYAGVKACMAKGMYGEPTELLGKAITFGATAAPMITEGLKGNPRQVKRFLNAFGLRKQLAEIAKLTNIEDAVLVKLMILEYAREARFRQLYDWQAAQDGQPQEIVRLEEAIRGDKGSIDNEDGAKKVSEEWGAAWLRRWVAMDPPLAGVDLRDYFWVARDRLQTTMTGLSMVPPLVRRAFEGITSGNAGQVRTAVASIKEFDEDEREALFTLLRRHVAQKLDEKAGFDGLRALVESDVAGAATCLAQVFLDNPSDDMPPAVGGDIVRLAATKPAAEQILQPAIERLKKATTTKIGRAVEVALKTTKK